MTASRFFSFDSTRATSWFPRLHWGWLVTVAGAHAAGLAALSSLGSGTPARPAEPVMVVRLLPPAGPAAVSSQAHSAAEPHPAPPATHDDIPSPLPAAPASDASPPRPSSIPGASVQAAAKSSKPASIKPATKHARAPHPPEPLPGKPAQVGVEENAGHSRGDVPPAEPAPVAPSPAAAESAAAPANHAPPPSAGAAAASAAHTSQGAALPMTEARFDAAYLSNPAPSYPRVSRRRGEEGRVVLRVRVLADGAAGAVEIAEGSGHPRLDDAARETVKNWRFVPASKGDVKIESWLNVPIVFRLED